MSNINSLFLWDKLNSVSRLEVVQLANISVISVPILSFFLEQFNKLPKQVIDISIFDQQILFLYICGLMIFLSKIVIGMMCPPLIVKCKTLEGLCEQAARIRQFQNNLYSSSDVKMLEQIRSAMATESDGGKSDSARIIQEWSDANSYGWLCRYFAGVLLYLGAFGIVIYFIILLPYRVFSS